MRGRTRLIVIGLVAVALVALGWLAYRPQRFVGYGASELAASVRDGANASAGKCITPGGRDRRDAMRALEHRGVDGFAAKEDGSEMWLCQVSTDPISGPGASYLVFAADDGSWRGFEVVVEHGFPTASSGRINVVDYIE